MFIISIFLIMIRKKTYLCKYEFNFPELFSQIKSKIDSDVMNKIIEIAIYVYFTNYFSNELNYTGLIITYNSEPIIFFKNETPRDKYYLYFETSDIEDKFVELVNIQKYINFTKKNNKNKLDLYNKRISECYFVGLCTLNIALTLFTMACFL